MGPRSADRGNVGAVYLLFFLAKASMGPRSADRGNTRLAATAAIGQLASMGPRSADRGNLLLMTACAAKKVLQWGRDQLIAEISKHGGGKFPLYQLPWGRRPLIVGIWQGSVLRR